MYDIDEAKEDTNNDSNADGVNDIDNDLADDGRADDDPDYRKPEAEQNPKLRAIQWVEKKNKGVRKGIASQNNSFRIFHTSEEFDSDPVRRAKLKRDDHGLIVSIPKDGNDLVDKHFSNNHHIKSIYFDDEDEYMKILIWI